MPSLPDFKDKLPIYPELFGSPDICECERCRSVYSPETGNTFFYHDNARTYFVRPETLMFSKNLELTVKNY